MIVCFFDIDGTLLASGGAGKAALEQAFTEEFGVDLRCQIPYAGRTDRAISRDMLQMHGIDYTSEQRQRLLNAYLDRLPGSLTRHHGRVLPGIGSLLETLRQRKDIALGLLTGNVQAGARVKLGHYGLYDHFAFGGFGDHHYDRDDVAREALGVARARLGSSLTPDRMWVIGDTPLDVQCARAIGARALAVATGVHSLEQLETAAPDLAFANLSDPGAFLARLG
jgi:phosphoglycolate phosphatase-like HAD superfamily hydrolase